MLNFDEFKATTQEEWKAKLTQELKGAAYEDKLVWQTWEGIKVPADFFPEKAASSQSFARGAANNDWVITGLVNSSEALSANAEAMSYLEGGCNGLLFSKPQKATTTAKLFDQIQLDLLHVSVNSNGDLTNWLTWLSNNQVGGFSLLNSPVANWVAGNSTKEEMQTGIRTAAAAHSNLAGKSQVHLFSVDGQTYDWASANSAQQIALLAAEGIEYLDALTAGGKSIDNVAPRLQFRMALDTNFFFQIAKIRALRQVWANVIKGYNPEHNCTHNAFIQAQSSAASLSNVDEITNLLRLTTMGASAAMAGVEAIALQPHQLNNQEVKTDANRWAKNIQWLLKEESLIHEVGDQAGGSYYIEWLTNELATKAWAYLQTIESDGGLIKHTESGALKMELGKSLQAKKELVEAGKWPLVGANKYQVEETASEPTEIKPNWGNQEAAKVDWFYSLHI